mmetsp:Transcript_38463/g.46409  ORF Transcript_38463/g.46409 Transcript_38463/m.46409 type:complete len:318 (+) Transcript_38463:305-1258(+)|eukprot:CAMPEP_0197849278 /NCGR_PEP_ID=MMETSP1438-20131217/11453_1 /TAXON_ID=1461541 /ORGANISM="Pterosperma sp., Strain CCMP1384" /LENGTH=317 /DNA_ID=CAMNT_0043461875 /DNA_START=267 /DNA_END=1220 /DNA_ORIENTATION=+
MRSFGEMKKFEIIASAPCEAWAQELQRRYPEFFRYHETTWGKFPDGTDNIKLGGFNPDNYIRGSHVIFLACFENNSATLTQLYACIALLESLIESLTIVLPFYPVGTMERVVVEGEVATANTLARLLSSLPACGKPTRVLLYDLHTLQNRFYLSNHAVATLHSSIPLLLKELMENHREIDVVAFPDDGAAKRFGYMFREFHQVVCGKKREGEKRKVTIMDGDPSGKNIVIVDDLVQSGGTLYECGRALQEAGANKISAFVAHGVFPNESWKRFANGGDRCIFDPFWVTNSIPTVACQLPKQDVFHVLDLLPQIVEDL